MLKQITPRSLIVLICLCLSWSAFSQNISNDTESTESSLIDESGGQQESPKKLQAVDNKILFKDSREDSPDTPITTNYILALIVLALLICATWLLRRNVMNRIARGGSRIKVCERKRISYGTFVTVLEIDGQHYVMAEGNSPALIKFAEHENVPVEVNNNEM